MLIAPLLDIGILAPAHLLVNSGILYIAVFIFIIFTKIYQLFCRYKIILLVFDGHC